MGIKTSWVNVFFFLLYILRVARLRDFYCLFPNRDNDVGRNLLNYRTPASIVYYIRIYYIKIHSRLLKIYTYVCSTTNQENTFRIIIL